MGNERNSLIHGELHVTQLSSAQHKVRSARRNDYQRHTCGLAQISDMGDNALNVKRAAL